MDVPAKAPVSVKAAQALFFLNAAIWLILGIVSLARMMNSGQMTTALMIAIMMLGNAGAMVVAGVGIRKRNKLLYYFGVAVLVVHITNHVAEDSLVF